MKSNINNDVEKLKQLLANSEDVARLKNLEKLALKGEYYRHYARRFLFGFGVAPAIEKWLEKIKPKKGESLREHIPKDETVDVVIAIVRQSYLRALIIVLLSSSASIVTAYFLYEQLIQQKELISVQREKNELDNRVLYTKLLYNDVCIESNQVKRCVPEYNHRQRTEAARAFSKFESDLSRAYLQGTNLSGLNLSRTSFQRAKLSKANLQHSNLQEVNFEHADLQEADLSESNLSNSDMSSANLEDAALLGAMLDRARLYGANLEDTSLDGASLRGAFLQDADLSGADLRGADLNGASFERANLEGAQFGNANIIGANFQSATYSEDTEFPKDFNPIARGMTKVFP